MAMNIEVNVDGVVAGMVRRLMLIKFVLGRIGQDKLCGLQAACVVIHARQTGRKTCKRPVNSEQTGFRCGLFAQA